MPSQTAGDSSDMGLDYAILSPQEPQVGEKLVKAIQDNKIELAGRQLYLR